MSDNLLHAEWPAPANIIAGTTLRQGSASDLPVAPQWLHQVHGTGVVRAGSSDFDHGPPDADAIIANRPGDICVVQTADCLPILLCSFDGTEIAAVHGGWRGLADGIVEATVAAMSKLPSELMAWFGPAISQAAFEVGDEVRERFGLSSPSDTGSFVANERGRWQADLYHLARARLHKIGVAAIHGGGLCTFSDAERFFSYRRDGKTGRLLSFIYRES